MLKILINDLSYKAEDVLQLMVSRLLEVIVKLNNLHGAEVSDNDKLHFVNGIVTRIEREENVMTQIRRHD